MNGTIRIKLAFSPNSKLSYEYVKEKETFADLTQLVKNYIAPNNVELEITIFEKEEAEKLSFVSVSEIKEIETEKEKEQKLKSFLENQYVMEAEKIFNQKVEKVIINNKE
jgi:hypothetical protein